MIRWDSYRRELNSFTEINLTNINFRIRYFNSERFWVDRKRTNTVFPPINYKSGSRECTLNNIKHPKIPDDLTSYSYQRRHESGGGRAYRRQWERVRRFNRIFIFTLFLFYNFQLVSLIKNMFSLIVCLTPLSHGFEVFPPQRLRKHIPTFLFTLCIFQIPFYPLLPLFSIN